MVGRYTRDTCSMAERATGHDLTPVVSLGSRLLWGAYSHGLQLCSCGFGGACDLKVTCSLQEVEQLESVCCLLWRRYWFYLSSSWTGADGAGSHLSLPGGHWLALVQLSWWLLVTAGIEGGRLYCQQSFSIVCAGFESHSQCANTCIIKTSSDIGWHPALAQGPKLNDCGDQKVLSCLQVKVDVLLGQC